jgi:hypothetical protein
MMAGLQILAGQMMQLHLSSIRLVMAVGARSRVKGRRRRLSWMLGSLQVVRVWYGRSGTQRMLKVVGFGVITGRRPLSSYRQCKTWSGAIGNALPILWMSCMVTSSQST